MAAILAGGLVGCGGGLGADVLAATQITLFGHPDATFSRETVNNIPYASIAVKIGKGPRSLLILWRSEREEMHWLSADGAALVTRHGRVVRTAGLPATIRDTVSSREDPLVTGLHQLGETGSWDRELDLDPEGPVLLYSTFRVIGPRSIEISEINFDTILVEEHVETRGLNWSFTNRYWVDPADGFVWRSRQTIARNFPAVDIEVLKPPAL